MSSAGLYVFGLGRNAAVSVTLKTKSNNSASSQVPVNVQKKVQKRLYVEQKINGLPKKSIIFLFLILLLPPLAGITANLIGFSLVFENQNDK